MVRMLLEIVTDELLNVRTLKYGTAKETGGAAKSSSCVVSNNSLSEIPYSVTGTVKHEGSKEAPKYEMLRKKYRNEESYGYVETLF